MGRPASTDKAVTVSIRIPESLVAEVDRLAGNAGVSRSDWLRAQVMAGVTIPVSPAVVSLGAPVEQVPFEATRGPSVAPGSVETPEGEPAAPVSPLAPPTGEGVFIANPVTWERTGVTLAEAGDRLKESMNRSMRLPVPDKLPCRHPRWRRLGGVCLSCGEKVR